MTTPQKRKGFGFERRVAHDFQKIGYPGACRQLEQQESDCLGVDLANTGYYGVQCKRWKQHAPISKLYEVDCDRQAERAGVDIVIPVLVSKADHKEAVASLPWEHLARLLKLEVMCGEMDLPRLTEPTESQIADLTKKIRSEWTEQDYLERKVDD